jgi:dihydrodipicolinate synthase/N-acetylneuraminate lyase
MGGGAAGRDPAHDLTPDRGGGAACARLQAAITDLGVLHTHGHWLPALKAACAFCGLGNGIPSPPLAPATEEQRQAIAAILTRHGFPRAS